MASLRKDAKVNKKRAKNISEYPYRLTNYHGSPDQMHYRSESAEGYERLPSIGKYAHHDCRFKIIASVDDGEAW